MLLFMCVLSIMFHASKCNSKLFTCPTWTYPSPPHNKCVCGATLHNFIICDPDTLTAFLTVTNVCILFSEELQTTLAGTCPYMAMEESYQTMYQRSKKRVLSFAFICIEQASFVESVRKMTLYQSIHIT